MLVLAGGLLGGMALAAPVMAADAPAAAPAAAAAAPAAAAPAAPAAAAPAAAPSAEAEKAAKEAAIAAAIAAPPAEAAMLANTCAGCHGTNGVSAGPSMPTIAGLSAPYLKHVMAEFKSGKRPSTIMGRIAKGYTEEETARLADFLSKAKWQNVASHANSQLATKVDDARAKKGKKLVDTQKCGKCHEDDGLTQDEDTPRMAGQWVDYLLIKMQDFKNQHLTVPQPEKMQKAIDKLSPQELEDIAHFYASKR
ncbi:MAG: c-type cytochrome [Magnetococcales bacterium]|nr:c-type cytochrome [Magnetococcales bacterium]